MSERLGLSEAVILFGTHRLVMTAFSLESESYIIIFLFIFLATFKLKLCLAGTNIDFPG